MYKILISFYQGEINLSVVRCFYSKNKVLNINSPISFNRYSHQIRMKILPKYSYFPLLYSKNINASRCEFRCKKINLSLNRKDFSTLQNTVIGNADTVYGKQQLWLIWITSSHLLMLKLSNIWVQPKDFLLEIKWLSNSVGFTLISDLTQFCFTRHCVLSKCISNKFLFHHLYFIND